MKKKRFVITIAGASGCGKTALVKKIAEKIHGSALFFDNYSHSLERENLDENSDSSEKLFDPKLFTIPRMANDLELLLAGKTITEPLTGEGIRPRNYIIVEDPYGRERQDIGHLYDYVVLEDTPLEICLARVLMRVFGGKYFMKEGTKEFIPRDKADFIEKLEVFEKHLNGQYWSREYYINLNNFVRKNVDLIIDGLGSLEDITELVLKKFKKFKTKTSTKK
ncbi:MAG: hypothetical protein JXA54_11820 [Candidatus Heimdallarchaeota archaeon]|nr:hypothetical protein [Candidatus Heimdallarchaeota archaeon]